jgi:hypothetical protein
MLRVGEGEEKEDKVKMNFGGLGLSTSIYLPLGLYSLRS